MNPFPTFFFIFRNETLFLAIVFLLVIHKGCYIHRFLPAPIELALSFFLEVHSLSPP